MRIQFGIFNNNHKIILVIALFFETAKTFSLVDVDKSIARKYYVGAMRKRYRTYII